MTDWADKMASGSPAKGPGLARYLRARCIPISRVKEWLDALEGAGLGSSGVMAEAAVKDRLREILGHNR